MILILNYIFLQVQIFTGPVKYPMPGMGTVINKVAVQYGDTVITLSVSNNGQSIVVTMYAKKKNNNNNGPQVSNNVQKYIKVQRDTSGNIEKVRVSTYRKD